MEAGKLSEQDLAMDLYRQAYSAYQDGEYEEALRLAKQAVVRGRDHPMADSIWAHAQCVIRQAQRHLDNPNPSIIRRFWWAIDGGWVVTLSYGTLGAPAENGSA